MVSDTALADIDTMITEKGLCPTPQDIIRLNALALRVERAGDPDSCVNAPRICWLFNVAIHEPTIQAELWIAEVAEKLSSTRGVMDTLCIYACAHARIPGFFERALMNNVSAIKARVAFWSARNLWKVTPRQITAALEYVTNGDDQGEGEYPDLTEAHPNRLKSVSISRTDSLHQGMRIALAAGLHKSDIECLTWTALDGILGRMYRSAGSDIKNASAMAYGDYVLTLESITKRLQLEKDAQSEKAE
jgi:hypothetical protein